MLKFIKHHMASMEGVEIYPLLALGIFISVFLYYVIWATRVDKAYVNHLSDLPLDETEQER